VYGRSDGVSALKRNSTTTDGTRARRLSARAAGNPYLLLAAASLFWSGNHVVGRAIAGEVPPVALGMIRWLLPAIFLWPFAKPHLARDWPEIRSHWLLLLFLGVTGGAIFSAGQYIGLQYTTALNTSVLNSLTPVFIVATGALIFRDRLATVQLAGIATSLCGVLAIVTRLDFGSLARLEFNGGDIVIVLNMALFAVYSCFLRFLPKLHWLSFVYAIAVVSTLATLPFALWEHALGRAPQMNGFVLFGVLYVAIFPSVVSYATWTRGVEMIGSNRAGPFLHLVPLYSALLASIFLGERLMAYHILGFGLILGGVFLASQRA
jgi:drug/metabolite transporter (DMT)-like permease